MAFGIAVIPARGFYDELQISMVSTLLCVWTGRQNWLLVSSDIVGVVFMAYGIGGSWIGFSTAVWIDLGYHDVASTRAGIGKADKQHNIGN